MSDAASLARLYAHLCAPGDGRLGLTAAQKVQIAAIQTDADDRVLGIPMRKGLGYWIAGPNQAATAPMGEDATSFGHPGAGGSVAWADRARRIGVAIVRNRMTTPGSGRACTVELGEIVRQQVEAVEPSEEFAM